MYIGPWLGGKRKGFNPSDTPAKWKFYYDMYDDIGVDFADSNGDPIDSNFDGWLSGAPNSGTTVDAYMTYVRKNGVTGWDDLNDREETRFSRFPFSLVVEYEMHWCTDQSSSFLCSQNNFDLEDLCPRLRENAFLVTGPPPGDTSASVSGICHANMPRGKYFEVITEYVSDGVSQETTHQVAQTLYHNGCRGALASIRSLEESDALKKVLQQDKEAWTDKTEYIIGPYIGGFWDDNMSKWWYVPKKELLHP